MTHLRQPERRADYDTEEFRRLWHDADVPLRDLAARYEVGISSLTRAARRRGYPDRRTIRNTTYDDATFRADWFDVSRPLREIAAEYGRSETALCLAAQRRGFPSRSRIRAGVA